MKNGSLVLAIPVVGKKEKNYGRLLIGIVRKVLENTIIFETDQGMFVSRLEDIIPIDL